MKKLWGYGELPEGFYSASISDLGNNRFMFRATPNRGDWCVEGIYKSEDDAFRAATEFVAGKTGIEGLYSASF